VLSILEINCVGGAYPKSPFAKATDEETDFAEPLLKLCKRFGNGLLWELAFLIAPWGKTSERPQQREYRDGSH
jgi:hypothetical protein